MLAGFYAFLCVLLLTMFLLHVVVVCFVVILFKGRGLFSLLMGCFVVGMVPTKATSCADVVRGGMLLFILIDVVYNIVS